MSHLIKSNFLFLYLNKLNVFPLSCGLSQTIRKYSKKVLNDSTLNDEELDKFRQMVGTIDWWTDPQFAALRQLNELRVPFIRDAFNRWSDSAKPLNGIKLLDIGCGPGILSEPLARLGANVTSIDPVKENIEYAVNHMKNDKEITDNLKYESISIEELSSKEQMSEYFDGVIASEVVEHIDNIDLFLSSGIKCLKRGGHLFITTINQTPIALFAAIFMAEYVLNLVPKGSHQYNKLVKPQALALILQEYGCNVSLIHGMAYNPLTGRWFWTQNQTINYALKATKN